MAHILIQNQGELPLWGMRLLGLSNKSPDQIGQFGTGLKESIALLSRMNLSMIIYSGTCRIDFSTQTFEGQDEICFMLSEDRPRFPAGTWHGLGIHPNFGHADWNDSWMILREIMCNALDESPLDMIYHDVSSLDPCGVAGVTRVYLPAKADLIEAYGLMQNRILCLSSIESIFACDKGEILSKQARHPHIQVFYKGVYVQEDKMESIYDYNLNRLKLNESRSADWFRVDSVIGGILSVAPASVLKPLLEELIPDQNDKVYESRSLTTCFYALNVSNGEEWRKAFYDLYGSDCYICPNDKHIYSRACEQNINICVVYNEILFRIFKNCGILSVTTKLSESVQKYDSILQPTAPTIHLFDAIWQQYMDLDLTQSKSKPDLSIFTQLAQDNILVLGSYSQGTCFINKTCVGSDMEKHAIIEEISHHISGATDYSREFQDFFLATIMSLLAAAKAPLALEQDEPE